MSKFSKIKKIIFDVLKVVVPLSLGILLLTWVYQGMHWKELLEILKGNIQLRWIAVVVVLCFLGHYVRALRWQMLTNSVKPHLPIMELFNAVLLNYGVNLVFPRLGEVSRCVAISKRENLPFTTLFGTLLSERICDTFSALTITLIAVTIQFDYFMDNMTNIEHYVDPFVAFLASPWFYAALMVVAGAVVVFYRTMKDSAIVEKGKNFLVNIWTGITAIAKLENGWRYLLLTVALWGIYLLQVYLCFFAFDFTSHLTFAVGLVAFAMGSLAYGLPVQGAIGPWHFAIILTLVFYGVDREHAAAFALVAHTVPTLVMAFGGIFASVWFSKSKKIPTESLVNSAV